MTIDELRALFPITRQKTYLFNGNIVPCASPVRQAMEEFLDQWSSAGDACWELGVNAFAQAKRLFAELIHAPADTIVGIPNTTTGINMAALMIRPQAGQNVVVTELEHMSNVYPWLQFKAHGVDIRYVAARDGKIDMEDFARAVDEHTAAVSICHVTMETGFRWDMSEACIIAHEHGACVVVDAAQAAGAIPIDVRAWGVDFLAAPTFKWMLGPLGAGFLYVCPERVEACDPPLPGWFGVINPLDNDLHHPHWHLGAQKFERGVPSMISFVGAAAGLQLLEKIGHETVFKRIAELVTYLCDGIAERGVKLITPADPQHRAGIVAIQLQDHTRLCQQLEQQAIHVGDWLGCLRVDPACYNTVVELDELRLRLRDFAGAPNAN